MSEHDKDYDLSYKVGQLVGRVDSLLIQNEQMLKRFEAVEKTVDNHKGLVSKGLGILVSLTFIFSIAMSLIGDWVKKLIYN